MCSHIAKLLEKASRILKASAFTTDATLDALIVASRVMALSTVARRGIWLRAWQADTHSKQIVAAYRFQGGKLFGDHLDKILEETRDKKKAMPKSVKATEGVQDPFPFNSSAEIN